MTTYYKKIVEITKDYLGPAAERFVSRQVVFHLGKSPDDDLTKEDVRRIASSMKVSLSLLTKDERSVEEATRRINEVAELDGEAPVRSYLL